MAFDPAVPDLSMPAPSARRLATMLASLPPRPTPRPAGVEQVDEPLPEDELLPEEADEPAGYGPDPDYMPDAVVPEPTPPLPEPPAPGGGKRDPSWQG